MSRSDLTKPAKVEQPYVPAAWKREELTDMIDFAVYTEPRYGGMVTVDYRARGFRLGLSRHGRLASAKQYAGRRWRRQLEQDAAAYLHSAIGPVAADSHTTRSNSE